jgi:hypothetical protein
MRRKVIDWLDAFVHERLWTPWSLLVVVALLVAVFEEVRTTIPLQVSGVQDTLYATSAQVGATLLGFLIAVITLLAVLPNGPLVQRLREQKTLERAVRLVGRACLAMAALTGAGLAGLLIDRQPTSAAERASELGTGSYWVWVLVACVLVAARLLGSSIVTVIRAVRLALREP